MRGHLLSCCLGLAIGLASGEAAAEGNYGAIAYSPSTGAVGWAYDHASRGEAEGNALANCGRHAGDCVVPIWFRSACGALAVGSGGYGSGWGTSRSLAEGLALESCRQNAGGCAVKRWVCTTR